MYVCSFQIVMTANFLDISVSIHASTYKVHSGVSVHLGCMPLKLENTDVWVSYISLNRVYTVQMMQEVYHLLFHLQPICIPRLQMPISTPNRVWYHNIITIIPEALAIIIVTP